MAENALIKVAHVNKSFKLPHEKNSSIKSATINFYKHRQSYELQEVLKDITFSVNRGEFFGIVGRNGSGKSTLLKLLAGIYSPNNGLIEIGGRLTPFIELGVGFNPELTGRENVFLNGALLGFSRKETAALYEEIVSFAELEKFMDQKLKNYSSGMQVRLAFAIAIRAKSDILLLDEVLAVGDAAFQKKCFDYFKELKRNKQTVVFISHDMNAVREYCDRAILIDKGSIVAEGSSEEIAQKYTRLFLSERTNTGVADDAKRWGTGELKAEKVITKVAEKNITIEVHYKVAEKIESPIIGMSIYSPSGMKIFESNTKWKKINTGTYKPGDTFEVVWTVPNIFTNGTNYVSVAAADSSGLEFFDWWDEAASFIVDRELVTTAATSPDYEVVLNVD